MFDGDSMCFAVIDVTPVVVTRKGVAVQRRSQPTFHGISHSFNLAFLMQMVLSSWGMPVRLSLSFK